MQIHSIPLKEMLPGFKARLVHTKNITMAFWEIEQGAILPEHSHVHEQVAMIEEGEFELTVGGKINLLMEGEVCIIPSNVPHSGRAITNCKMTDIFSPVREDLKYKEG